jgi:hypothetical protein
MRVTIVTGEIKGERGAVVCPPVSGVTFVYWSDFGSQFPILDE